MLWNVVFEFYVKYIFGGRLSDTNYTAVVGQLYSNGWVDGNTNGIGVSGFNSLFGSDLIFPFGNYLSLIATIISMVVILVICCALIKKIYNMCAHIIG